MNALRAHIAIVFSSVLALLSVAPAQATAIFDAEATVTLSIASITGGDPDDLLIESLALVGEDDAFFTGSALANVVANATPAGDATLSEAATVNLTASADGSASPVGQSDAAAALDAALSFINNSDQSFTIDIIIEWTLSALVEVMDLVDELALATAALEVELVSQETLPLDQEITLETTDQLALSPPPLSDSLTLSFDIAPGAEETLLLLAEASGQASAGEGGGPITVPAPGSLVLMAIGIVSLLGWRFSG